MNKTHIDYTLSDDGLGEILHAMQYDPRPEVRVRATAIRLLHLGQTPSQAGEVLGVTRTTIHLWQRRYREQGIAGLADKGGQGRRRKATPAYVAALEEALAQAPTAFGHDYGVWTLPRLAAHLHSATGITLSIRALGDLLASLGYVYKRPKQTLKQLQDKDAVAQAHKTLAELKGGPSLQTPTTLQTGASQSTSSSLWTRPPVRSTRR